MCKQEDMTATATATATATTNQKQKQKPSAVLTRALREFVHPRSQQHPSQQIGGGKRRPAVPYFELMASTKCFECPPGPLQEGGLAAAATVRRFDVSAAMAAVPNDGTIRLPTP